MRPPPRRWRTDAADPCPWCGPRPENEFRYGGQAHVARPEDPSSVDDAAWAAYLTIVTTRRGGMWNGGATCTAAGASSMHPRYGNRPRSPAPTGRARAAVMTQPFRTAVAAGESIAAGRCVSVSMAGRWRVAPATRWPRRCWRTACIWWADRSSITGRAGYCRPGSEEPNALVTIDRGAGAGHAEPARHADRAVRRAGRRQPEPLSVASFRSRRRGGFRRAAAAAGFYYKTFMWPASFWTAAIRTGDPRARRDWAARRAEPTRTAMPHRYAHCDVLIIGGGAAGFAAALGASATGASGSSCAMNRRSWAVPCCPNRG